MSDNELIYDIDYDKYTTEQLKEMIQQGVVNNKDVVAYYCNEWWDETP